MHHKVTFLALFSCTACLHTHPVQRLERLAKKHDKTVALRTPVEFQNDAYLIPINDALSSAVRELERDGSVMETQNASVGSDWEYTGKLTVTGQGEQYTQTRSRSIIEFSDLRPEITVSSIQRTETRVATPTATPKVWSSKERPRSLLGLRSDLQRSEVEHADSFRSITTPSKVIGHFKTHVPPGFTFKEETADSITIERVSTERKEKTKRMYGELVVLKVGVWEYKETLSIRVDQSNRILVANETHSHRFSTETEEGEWRRATHNSSLAIDWLFSGVREGIRHGHIDFGLPERSVVRIKKPLSPPPSIPRLRTMAEIETIITQRAYETATGNFTLCLDHILINPTNPDGRVWDVALLHDVVGVVENVAHGASRAVAELNRVNDAKPTVGMIVDGGVTFLTGSAIDLNQAEQIAKATGNVAGWMQELLPTSPDMYGHMYLEGQDYRLKGKRNSLTHPLRVCHTTDFKPSQPYASLHLYDQDELKDPDFLGSCRIDLEQVIESGISGIGCGSTRAYMRATYNFSFGQIRVVGLPPVD